MNYLIEKKFTILNCKIITFRGRIFTRINQFIIISLSKNNAFFGTYLYHIKKFDQAKNLRYS